MIGTSPRMTIGGPQSIHMPLWRHDWITLYRDTFYRQGEYEDLIYFPFERLTSTTFEILCVQIEKSPDIWHGNTLTRNESYGGLSSPATSPILFDVLPGLNSPFGVDAISTPTDAQNFDYAMKQHVSRDSTDRVRVLARS